MRVLCTELSSATLIVLRTEPRVLRTEPRVLRTESRTRTRGVFIPVHSV
jgi:hypothetical protein